MPPPWAREFTPELSQDYLASQLNLINKREMENVGAARREGEAAGLVGQAATGSRVAAAADNADRDLESAVAGFNLDVANKTYSERMHEQDQAFEDTERAKSEDFKRQMTYLGYALQGQEDNEDFIRARHGSEQGFWGGLAQGAVGKVAGAFTSKIAGIF